jgi:hypothetical protein
MKRVFPQNRAFCGFHCVKEKFLKRLRDSRRFHRMKRIFVKRLRDSRDSIVSKKNSWKGSVIAEIPLCQIKIHEKAPWLPIFHCVKEKFVKRLCDSQDSIVSKKNSWKGSMIAEGSIVWKGYLWKGSVIAKIQSCKSSCERLCDSQDSIEKFVRKASW